MALTSTRAGTALLALVLAEVLPLGQPHNWVHNPRSRSGNKASTLIPGPAKPTDRDPHVQVGPGQTFEIEWTTGHPNSIFYFVVVSGADEDYINYHTEELLDDYVNSAPERAYKYNESIWAKYHLSCSYLYGEANCGDSKSCKNCGQGSEEWNEANYDVYKGLLATDSSLYANRSKVFESDEDGEHGVTAIEYTADTLSDDVRVAYYNSDYPWIEAVHRFTVEMKWAQEFDTARFDIPARAGSGEYLVHMVWRGYRDVIDVDVLPSEANDRYGRAASGVTWIKTDHCQYQRGTYESEGRKSWRVPGRTCFPLWPGNEYNASACLQACVDRGTSICEAANVVPLNNPSGVVDFLANNVNIPTDIDVGNSGSPNTDCDPSYMAAKYPDLVNRNDTLMCYGLIPDEDSSNDEVDDPWTIIDNDPMDPIFYSTCYRQGTAWEFVSNPACPACEAANASSVPWRYGDRCISCAETRRIRALQNTEVPWWGVIDDCEAC